MYQTEDYQSLNSQGLICLQLMSDTHYSSPKVGYSLLSLFSLWCLIDWLQLLSIKFAGYKNCVVRYLPLTLSFTELEVTFRLLKTNLNS